MRAIAVIIAAALFANNAAARTPTPLWLMNVAAWRDAGPEERAALIADYMRVFCGSITMSNQAFERCLNHRSDDGQAGNSMFPLAAQCVADLSG